MPSNPYVNLAASAYRQAAAAVHPKVAVVKLYDATLLALSQSIIAKDNKQHEESFIKVLRAATILRGLDHTLDYERGGAIAERLHRVYLSYILTLHLSFGKKDASARYRKLYISLAALRNSWASIAGMEESSVKPPSHPAGAEINASKGNVPAESREPQFDPSAFIGLTASAPTTSRPSLRNPQPGVRPPRPARPKVAKRSG